MLITAYVAAFLKRRQTIIAYPIPGPQPSILNIFWPFGSELYIVMEQYMKNVRAGQGTVFCFFSIKLGLLCTSFEIILPIATQRQSFSPLKEFVAADVLDSLLSIYSYTYILTKDYYKVR